MRMQKITGNCQRETFPINLVFTDAVYFVVSSNSSLLII
ncbi:hypothetical protein SLEP1_g19668 [Rubroshorea leprosula]|uniref:Uncharacterized protein n=1 Tax=Rubroshorea leprosula TaxID=152421 RepID=A0AAV5J037_9ROSI|nr:hypothetical protein SLEP1_g19668 [Rubroshorea leprosula]